MTLTELKIVNLQIALHILPSNRAAAAAVYQKYKDAFMSIAAGAKSKELLVREEDVQVLHGFDRIANAKGYLQSNLFTADVVRELGRLLAADPDIRIYEEV